MPPKRSRLQSSSDSDSDSVPLISSFASSKRPHQTKKSKSNPLSFSSNPSKSQSNTTSYKSTDQHRTVDDDDDFFVFVGTEFPDLSGETSRKNQDQSHLPVWQQDVRDEKGRKRLHGAFKGGFSAGYFNTVGSKEGWTPSTFVSSRSSRKEQTQLRPEDFMDEEDLEEIRNEKQTTATSTFSLFTSAPESQIGIGTEPAVGDGYLSNLVAPTSESMGTKIMKNMGWKPGQGLGPLVLIDVPTGKLKTAPKEDSARYLYSFQFQPKVDSHGLGFQAAKKAEGLQGLSAIAPGTTGKGPRALPAGAIGTGILNDFDPYEDSMDAVYSGVDLSQYDIAMNDADGREKQYLDRKAKAIADRQQKSEQNVKAREKTKSTTGEDRTKICSDGKNVLNGFVLADKASELTKWYFPPTLPPNWTPKAKIAVDAVMSKVGAKKGMSEEVEHDKSKPPEKLTVEERAAILGDPSVPVSQRSVFSFISAKDKARLHTLAAQKETTAAQEPKQGEWSQFKSIVTPELARTALKSHFVKTMADVGKRERLIQFLKVNAKETEDLLLLSDRRAQQQEFEEFVRLVRMFQPMSLGMASRFTSGSVLVGHNEQNVKPDGSVSENSDADMLRKDLDKEDPAASAAKMSLFGSLTRTNTSFFPHPLLCKRFNVPNPFPHRKFVESDKEVKELLNKDIMNQIMDQRYNNTLGEAEASADDKVADKRRIGIETDAEVDKADEKRGGEENDDLGLQPLELDVSDNRPSMDYFKSIFGNADDEAELTKKPPRGVSTAQFIPTGITTTADETESEVNFPPTEHTEETEAKDYIPQSISFQSTIDAEREKIDVDSFRPVFVERRSTKKFTAAVEKLEPSKTEVSSGNAVVKKPKSRGLKQSTKKIGTGWRDLDNDKAGEMDDGDEFENFQFEEKNEESEKPVNDETKQLDTESKAISKPVAIDSEFAEKVLGRSKSISAQQQPLLEDDAPHKPEHKHRHSATESSSSESESNSDGTESSESDSEHERKHRDKRRHKKSTSRSRSRDRKSRKMNKKKPGKEKSDKRERRDRERDKKKKRRTKKSKREKEKTRSKKRYSESDSDSDDRRRERKRRRRSQSEHDPDEMEGIWVEKPSIPSSSTSDRAQDRRRSGQKTGEYQQANNVGWNVRNRPKAADFM